MGDGFGLLVGPEDLSEPVQPITFVPFEVLHFIMLLPLFVCLYSASAVLILSKTSVEKVRFLSASQNQRASSAE